MRSVTLVGSLADTSIAPYAVIGLLRSRAVNSTWRGSLRSMLSRSKPPVICRKWSISPTARCGWNVRR
ncbi:MAG: hypothetical protein ACR2OG_12275 [Gemmatimonadaceae bacterium]